MVVWYNFDTFLYCSACPAGKDLGRDLESKFFKFGMILDCFLNDSIEIYENLRHLLKIKWKIGKALKIKKNAPW